MLVNGMNDLGVVDPAQVHRGDREVGVAQQALSSGTPSRDISTA